MYMIFYEIYKRIVRGLISLRSSWLDQKANSMSSFLHLVPQYSVVGFPDIKSMVYTALAVFRMTFMEPVFVSCIRVISFTKKII